MSYVFYSLLAAVLFSINILSNKVASKHSVNNPQSLTAYFLFYNFIIGFLFLFQFSDIFLLSPSLLFLIASMAVIYSAGFILFYKGIVDTDASVATTIFQLQAGIVALLAYFFLSERFPFLNYLWVLLSIVGAIFVTYDEKLSFTAFYKKGVLFIIVMQLIHSIYSIMAGSLVKSIPFTTILFWIFTTMGVIFCFYYLTAKPKVNYPLKKTYPLIIAAFANVLGSISIFKALETNTTLSITINLLQGPIVFIVSALASKYYPQLLEHHPPKVYAIRTIGLFLVLFAAYQIAVS